MRVRVYRNLNNSMLSIMEISSRLVMGHCQSIHLDNVQFKVNESGRQRVIKTCRKNVHAFAEGTIAGVAGFEGFKGRSIHANATLEGKPCITDVIIRYNPYKTAFFTNEQGEAVTKAEHCTVSCSPPFTTISRQLAASA